MAITQKYRTAAASCRHVDLVAGVQAGRDCCAGALLDRLAGLTHQMAHGRFHGLTHGLDPDDARSAIEVEIILCALVAAPGTVPADLLGPVWNAFRRDVRSEHRAWKVAALRQLCADTSNAFDDVVDRVAAAQITQAAGVSDFEQWSTMCTWHRRRVRRVARGAAAA